MNQEPNEPEAETSGLPAGSSPSKKVKYDLTGDDDASTPIRPDESPGMGWLWIPLVVILLVGAFFLRSSFSGGSARIHLADCEKNLKSLAQTVDSYAAQHKGAYPKSLEELVASGQLTALPNCPSAGTPTYKLVADGKKHTYFLFCGGLYHRDVLDKHASEKDAEDLPSYNSQNGEISAP